MNIEKKRKFEERRKEYLKNKLMNTLMEEEADVYSQYIIIIHRMHLKFQIMINTMKYIQDKSKIRMK